MANYLASKQASRNYNLDLIKILACVAVVGLHTLQKDLSAINQSIYYICGFAVPAFLMTTGYILLNRSTVSVKYSCKKIKRIIKVVLLWSLYISIVSVVVKAITSELSQQSFWVFPKTFLGSLVQRGILWQFWYLGALIILYLLYPVLVRYKEHLIYVWIVSAAIGLVIQIVSYVIGTPLQSYIIQTFRIWTWIQYFVLGGLIGNHKSKTNVVKRRDVIICFILTILIVVYQNFMGNTFLHNTYAEYFYDSMLTIMWLVSIFNLGLRIELSHSVKSIIQYIAPLTMGIYIVHPLVMRIMQPFVEIETFGMSCLFFLVILMTSAFLVWLMKQIPFAKQLIEL